MENIRKRLEEAEAQNLSKRAALSKNSKGRKYPLKECDVRTDFQRDKDRIIHSKSFRRLSHKTQVFLSPEGDHYRTRLTHTLEVSQISRTIARALRLNEDLTEAISLGHDLGHTPFGHEGEDALNRCLEAIKGKYKNAPLHFNHNEQSLRVVEILEYDGKGLNLTEEVKDGILNHTGPKTPSTLEGQIVKIADRVAYVNHDIDDALRAEVISRKDLPKGPIKLLGVHQSLRINAMILDIIENSLDKNKISLSLKLTAALVELRDFLFKKVYVKSDAKVEDRKVKQVVDLLFLFFIKNPEELPEDILKQTLPRRVTDYIAGMTDRFAIAKFEELFVPRGWPVRN